MRYFVLVERGKSKGQILADVLEHGRTKPAQVYVVGIDEGQALGFALQHGKLEADEMDAAERARFTYVEAIGAENVHHTIESLVGIAEHRIAEIASAGTTRRTVRR